MTSAAPRQGRPRLGGLADLYVHAGVEGVGGVGDVPDRQHLLPAGVTGEIDGVRDGGGGLGVVAADHTDASAADVVLPVGRAVAGGEGPGEGRGGADRRCGPALAVVVELRECGVAAVTAALTLGSLDTLRFVLD